MRALFVVAVLLGATAADAKPSAPKANVEVKLSARIGAKAPTLTIILTSDWAGSLDLAKVEDPACWVPLYFKGGLEKLDGTVVAPLKPCKKSGSEVIELDRYTSFTVEVPLDKLFKKIPKGELQLDLAWSSEAAVARDSKLTLWSDSTFQPMRFIVAKLVKAVTATRDTPVTLAKGVTLTLKGHGHETIDGPGESALLVAAAITQQGKTEEHDATVYGEGIPFAIGKHVFSMVDVEYDAWMKLQYWGTIALSP